MTTTGFVKLPDGSPAIGAQISYSSQGIPLQGDNNGQSTSGSDGSFQVPDPQFINSGGNMYVSATYYDGQGNEYAGQTSLIDQSDNPLSLAFYGLAPGWSPSPFTLTLSMQAAANPGVKQAVTQHQNQTSPQNQQGLFGNISSAVTYGIYALIAVAVGYVVIVYVLPELDIPDVSSKVRGAIKSSGG